MRITSTRKTPRLLQTEQFKPKSSPDQLFLNTTFDSNPISRRTAILRDQAEFAAAKDRKANAITGLKAALTAVNITFAEVPESQQLKVLKGDIAARLALLSP